jgi:hypothetical protein
MHSLAGIERGSCDIAGDQEAFFNNLLVPELSKWGFQA